MRILGRELPFVKGAVGALESILGHIVAWTPDTLYYCPRSPTEFWIVLRLPWRISVVVEFHLISLEEAPSGYAWFQERPRLVFSPLHITPMSVVSPLPKKGERTGFHPDPNKAG